MKETIWRKHCRVRWLSEIIVKEDEEATEVEALSEAAQTSREDVADNTKEAMKIKVVMKIMCERSVEEEDVAHEDEDKEGVTRWTDRSCSATIARSMVIAAMNVGRSQQVK